MCTHSDSLRFTIKLLRKVNVRLYSEVWSGAVLRCSTVGSKVEAKCCPHNEREEGATGWLDPLPVSSAANTFYTHHHHRYKYWCTPLAGLT